MAPIVRPKPPMANSAPSSTAPTVIKPPTGRPTPPAAIVAKTLPKDDKEEQTHEVSEPRIQKPAREESHPASEPVVSAGQPADSGQLGATTDETEEQEFTGQIELYQLRKMTVAEKHKLWRKLNVDAPSNMFVTVLRPDSFPKKIARLDPPAHKPIGKGILFCCYCGDWTIFESFAYIGSDKCIGCSISTKDFHNRDANKLWNEDV